MGNLAKQFEVDIIGYPLSYTKDENYLYLTSAGYIVGPSEKIKLLINSVKDSKNVVKFEENDNFIISVTKQPLNTEPVYDLELIRPNPAYISKEGYHIWEVASWEREKLNKIISFAQKNYGAEVLKLKEEKIKNISLFSTFPLLTDNQKLAFEIACSNNYYDYPRSIKLTDLAKIMGVSYSTYQEHLRKAERKLLLNR